MPLPPRHIELVARSGTAMHALYNFQLVIERTQGRSYRVRVGEHAAGERGEERVQLDPAMVFGGGPILRGDSEPRQMLRLPAVPDDEARRIGGLLFEKVFRGSVRACYENSRARAGQQGLRLELRFDDVPELVSLPWELLYDTSRKEFLARSKATPLVRHLRAELGGRFAVAGALKILVAVASPEGLAPLEAEREWQLIRGALTTAVRSGRVVLQRVSHGTLGEVHSQLRRGGWHVLHFIGHGNFTAHEGALVLESENGQQDRVKFDRFRDQIRGRGLQLVVLNVCESGKSSPIAEFTGMAQSLARAGIPAVVAMQQPVTDELAIRFSRSFYEELARGGTLEAAMTEARLALNSVNAGLAWANPVLYMSAPSAGLVAPLAGWRAAVARVSTRASSLLSQLRTTAPWRGRPRTRTWLVVLLLAGLGGGVGWMAHLLPASVAALDAALSMAATSPQAPVAGASSTARGGATTAQPPAAATQAPPREEWVWVNLATKVYHYKGDRWYGTTTQGKFMTEADALAAGYRPPKKGR